MPIDLAQQLRDIHEPAVPGFWPLAVSWWILFILSVILLSALIVWYVRRRKRYVPYKRIRNLARQLTHQRDNGVIDGLMYASGVNLLFKELLLDVEKRTESTIAFGVAWQNLLAQRFNNDAFVSGAGQCLGTVRFKGENFSDEGLSGLVQQTLLRAKPTKTNHNA